MLESGFVGLMLFAEQVEADLGGCLSG